MLVLVSDGIHKHVGPGEIGDVLRGSAPLARRCARLLALARVRGSSDDATVLVVRRETRIARSPRMAARRCAVRCAPGTALVHMTPGRSIASSAAAA